ncbi:MAG: alpha/beta hydrolase [Minwuia sp.]|nr:alpha/beta hydrolase [Minwuia sp.]
MNGADWAFDAPDGTGLKGLRWDVDDPRGRVYLVHGLAEHMERYDAFATALNAAGYSVAGHDQRGHGRTAAQDSSLGHFADHDGWTRMVDDARIGVAAWRGTQPDLPMILFGHSMGSFLVQQALWSWPQLIDGAVLSGSNGPPPPLAAIGRVIARIERLRLGRRGQSKLIHSLGFDGMNKTFQPARTDMDWLSRDPAMVDRYVADPCCGFVASTASWISLLDALPGLAASANVQRIPKDMPVHLAAGACDPVGDFGKGVERLSGIYQTAGLTDVTLRLYDGARHEILNEINRDEITTDLIARMDSMLEARKPA